MSQRTNKYSEVAQELEMRISAGRYVDGLPGKRVLAEEFAVTPVTMAKAIKFLKNSGVIRTEYGKGTFVTRLKRRRTHSLGIIVHDVPGGPLHQQLLCALHDRAGEFGENVILESHGGSADKEMQIVRRLVENTRVDGIIIWPARCGTPATSVYLIQNDIPHVLVPEPDLAVYGDSFTVNADDAGAASCAMMHLISAGRRRIGFMGVSSDNVVFHERREQYKACLEAQGLPVSDTIIMANGTGSSPAEVLQGLALIIRRFDAVFCSTDYSAATVIACCARYGIRVPTDLAVVGYDNSVVAKALDLTSVEQHFERIGLYAVDLLLAEIEERSVESRHIKVKSELVVRGSTLALR